MYRANPRGRRHTGYRVIHARARARRRRRMKKKALIKAHVPYRHRGSGGPGTSARGFASDKNLQRMYLPATSHVWRENDTKQEQKQKNRRHSIQSRKLAGCGLQPQALAVVEKRITAYLPAHPHIGAHPTHTNTHTHTHKKRTLTHYIPTHTIKPTHTSSFAPHGLPHPPQPRHTAMPSPSPASTRRWCQSPSA